MCEISEIPGAVTAPAGFLANGLACGIKKSGKPDFALILSEHPTSAAGVFTTNMVKAAPVLICKERLLAGNPRAILANSGNANACTGGVGHSNAEALAGSAAAALQLQRADIFVASTGRIGVQLPMQVMEPAIEALVAGLSADGGPAAATAIMTSDTRPKEFAVEVKSEHGTYRIGGIAKGAGMINPHMATMLCFVTTDAKMSQVTLQQALTHSATLTFNRITVDGDMSTNDTLLALANGASGFPEIASGTPEFTHFQEALTHVTQQLARKIVEDGECITRVIAVEVTEANDTLEANLAAKAIANSILVKSAWSGGDPNWGRILCAAGYSGATFDQYRANIWYGALQAVENGMPTAVSKAQLTEAVAPKELRIRISLGAGDASATVWTTDLTPAYVVYNQSE